ncbi:MAG TPA: YgiQ family radical SAM protein, partial [Pirellulales bacterium]|nr:YgiQ family radical SAM protein [Pirellulales bacterium]
VYGMGERAIVEIARRLDQGQTARELRDMRGVVYRLGAKEVAQAQGADWSAIGLQRAIELPSYEQAAADKLAFADMTRIAHNETNPHNARPLVQRHGPEAIVCTPAALPLSQAEMDHVYGQPFTRRPHPSYGKQKIPAYDVVRESVQIMRGCFGGCTFCSITAHEGRIIQSRSPESVLAEVRQMTADPTFSGTISDIGGPTANMYQMRCTRPEVEAKCRRLSCVHPTICKLLGTDHGPLIGLMRDVREEPGVKQVFVASGIRMDLARRSPEYMRELAEHHVGGHLKVAPEHIDPGVLDLMKKPANDDFIEFDREFQRASQRAGKKQYLVPYFIASHPGSGLDEMIELAQFLKRNGYRPDQVQDFIPSPFDIAACMYHTGLDPHTKKRVYVAQHLRDRKLQRALLQFFKPENYFEVRQALEQAGRQDLIGSDCDCLIPDRPPKEALTHRRRNANDDLRGRKPTQADETGGHGYRPGRKTARRRSRR